MISLARGWATVSRRRLVLLAVFFLLSSGCAAVGPDYAPPALDSPPAWTSAPGGGVAVAETTPETLARWWATLDDPVLTMLVERAVSGNLDLSRARARVREARARRRIAAAGLLPTLDGSASLVHSRASDTAGFGDTRELYSVGFDASWELDVFGGVRRSVESADASLQASVEDVHDVLVSLLAELALNYVEVRSAQNRLAIAGANLNTQEETFELTRWRFEAGLTTQLDVEQAKFNLEQTRSQIPTLRIALEQAENRIALLLGDRPGALAEDLGASEPIPATPPEVVIGVPADVLRQRPDVRRAERELAAQTAQVGVAAADLYPKFSLIGSIGLESLSLGDLFTAGSRTYGIGPSMTWRLFDAGAIRGNIEAQTALVEQAHIAYEAAILTALEDVENALIAYSEEQTRRRSLAEATEAARRAVDLAGFQYSSGLIDFQVVLVAQRSLFSLQDQLVLSEAGITSNLITLYKALGGRWTPPASSVAAADPQPGEPGRP